MTQRSAAARLHSGPFLPPDTLKTGKALGLTIPPSVLARADEIIQ
jgi:hypothetical protein